MCSILYPTKYVQTARLTIEDDLLEDYFSPLEGFFHATSIEKKYFISVLKTPLCAESDIRYRQAVFCDFLRDSVLLDLLLQFADAITLLQKELRESRRRMNSARIVQGQSVAEGEKFHSTFAMLQDDCVAFCSLVVQITEFINRFSQHRFQSEGLKNVMDVLSSYSLEREVVAEAAERCRFLSVLSETEFLKNSGITVHYVEDLQFEFADITYSEESLVTSLFSRQSSNESEYKTILNRACENLRNELKKIFEGACSVASELQKELGFYRIGLALEKSLEKYSVPHCFPQFAENFDFRELYDLRLQMKLKEVSMDARTVSVQSGFCLITGANNSGKTVFLRSVILAQLFAQSGLFVPARSVTVPLYSNIAVLFAAKESRNPVGRFESEVRQLAEINESAAPGRTLVVLNEIFQSAPYQEGCGALFAILEYWKKRGIHWFAVTHLNLCQEHELDAHVHCIHFAKPY